MDIAWLLENRLHCTSPNQAVNFFVDSSPLHGYGYSNIDNIDNNIKMGYIVHLYNNTLIYTLIIL